MSNTIGKISDTASATATASIRSHILNLIAVLGAAADAASDSAGVSAVALLRKLLARDAGGVVSVFPDAAAGAALTAGAANTYGDLVSVSGALAAASRVVSLVFDTPAVAIEPCQWQLSYGAGATVVASGIVPFKTDVGTHQVISLLGTCGVIPAGSTLQVKIRTATGGTTCKVHCATMPA